MVDEGTRGSNWSRRAVLEFTGKATLVIGPIAATATQDDDLIESDSKMVGETTVFDPERGHINQEPREPREAPNPHVPNERDENQNTTD